MSLDPLVPKKKIENYTKTNIGVFNEIDQNKQLDKSLPKEINFEKLVEIARDIRSYELGRNASLPLIQAYYYLSVILTSCAGMNGLHSLYLFYHDVVSSYALTSFFIISSLIIVTSLDMSAVIKTFQNFFLIKLIFYFVDINSNIDRIEGVSDLTFDQKQLLKKKVAFNRTDFLLLCGALIASLAHIRQAYDGAKDSLDFFDIKSETAVWYFTACALYASILITQEVLLAVLNMFTQIFSEYSKVNKCNKAKIIGKLLLVIFALNGVLTAKAIPTAEFMIGSLNTPSFVAYPLSLTINIVNIVLFGRVFVDELFLAEKSSLTIFKDKVVSLRNNDHKPTCAEATAMITYVTLVGLSIYVLGLSYYFQARDTQWFGNNTDHPVAAVLLLISPWLAAFTTGVTAGWYMHGFLMEIYGALKDRWMKKTYDALKNYLNDHNSPTNGEALIDVEATKSLSKNDMQMSLISDIADGKNDDVDKTDKKEKKDGDEKKDEK